MAQKKDFSIENTFHQWLEVESAVESSKVSNALLFGNIAAGKTALGHLFNRYVNQRTDEKFGLNDKKTEFVFDNEINPKSLKPLTIYPKVFRVNNPDKPYNLIEVPSRIYQLEPKKRPTLDRLIHLVGLAHAAKKACFLFLVDPKTTSAKFDGWKKLFQTVLDGFRAQFLNAQNYKSMGFIVDKSTGDIQQKAYINRMKSLNQLFTEDRKDQYIELLKSIQDNQNLRVLKKIQGDWPAKEQIVSINEFIKSLKQVELCDKEDSNSQLHVEKPFELTKEETEIWNGFNECLKKILGFFKLLLQQIFNSKQNRPNLEGFLASNKDKIQQLSGQCTNFDEKSHDLWSAKVRNKFKELLQTSQRNKNVAQSIIGKSSLYMQLRGIFLSGKDDEKNILSDFLGALAKNGLVFQHSQHLQNIYMRLIEYSLFEQRFSHKLQVCDYKFLISQQKTVQESIKQGNLEKLKQQFISKQFTSQNPIKILELFDLFYPDNSIEQGTQIYKKKQFIREMIDLQNMNPRKMVEVLDKYLNKIKPENTEQKKNFYKKIAIEAAKTLQSLERHDLCAPIYSNLGKIYKAKTSYQKMIKASQKNPATQLIDSYIKVLRDMKLQETALQRCYQFSQEYGQKDKQISTKLLQHVQDILKNRGKSQTLTESQKQLFKGQKSGLISEYISKQLLVKIKQFVDSSPREERI